MSRRKDPWIALLLRLKLHVRDGFPRRVQRVVSSRPREPTPIEFDGFVSIFFPVSLRRLGFDAIGARLPLLLLSSLSENESPFLLLLLVQSLDQKNRGLPFERRRRP